MVRALPAGQVTLLFSDVEGSTRLLQELGADAFGDELARHRRSGMSLTLLVLDLDGFKEINDTRGHLAGDRVLVEVAGALRSALRSQDTLSRQGGDEFSILAPETDGMQAEQLARRSQEDTVTLVQPRPGELAAKNREFVSQHDNLELLELGRAQPQRRHRKRTPK